MIPLVYNFRKGRGVVKGKVLTSDQQRPGGGRRILTAKRVPGNNENLH